MNVNAKIRVCHFSTVHSIIDTRVFYRECVSLAKHYDVTLIAVGEFTGKRNGVNVIGIKKAGTRMERIFTGALRVFAAALKTDASIYHIHDAELLPFGIILSILGKKVIYDIHENTKHDILLKPWIPAALKYFLAAVYDLLLWAGTFFMHYIVVTADKKFLPLFHVRPGQHSVIQNFADPVSMRKYLVEDRSILPGNHIFYVGMIKDTYYDFNKVIDAVYLLKNEHFPVFIHCVGYFGARATPGFEDHPHWNEVKEQIHFYGYLDMDTAYKISMQCKLGICLKDQPEESLVSHERKFFEYMAIALPSIFCDSKIYTAVNDEYRIGSPVDLQDPTEIAAAIKNSLSDKTLYKELQQNCIRAVEEKYNWGSQEDILLGNYSYLLGQKP